jgi:hypothetical protein
MWTILLPIATIATMNAFFAPFAPLGFADLGFAGLGFAPVRLPVENDDSQTPDSGL